MGFKTPQTTSDLSEQWPLPSMLFSKLENYAKKTKLKKAGIIERKKQKKPPKTNQNQQNQNRQTKQTMHSLSN